MNHEHYPDYKTAGVSWLTDVPAHWDVQRAKSLFRIIDVKSKTGKEELLTVSSANGIVRRRESNVNMFKAKTYVGHKLCWPKDLVINSLWAWGRGLGFAREHGIISSAYGVYRLRSGHEHLWEYLDYTLRSSAYQWELQVRSKGVWKSRLQLSDASFLDMPILIPPKEDAELIVRYLRALDAKVKRYIRTKRTLIAALQEQKQAIIQRAVTRGLPAEARAKAGLDPKVKLKPSGVEWLGEVPEHWEVRRSKTLFRERKELARPSDVQLSATQAYGVIPQDEFEARVGRRVVKISMHLEKRKHVELDDFVISMRSFQGGLERAWAAGAIRSSYVILKPLAEVDVDFYTYVLKSPGYIKALQSTADFIRDGQDLNFADFSKVPLPLPPRDEQRGIALHIRKALISTEEALTRVAREIDVIQEYHTRLIADVVTGAVDVTAAAKALPDDQMIGRSEDQMMEEEPLSMAAEGEAEYGT